MLTYTQKYRLERLKLFTGKYFKYLEVKDGPAEKYCFYCLKRVFKKVNVNDKGARFERAVLFDIVTFYFFIVFDNGTTGWFSYRNNKNDLSDFFLFEPRANKARREDFNLFMSKCNKISSEKIFEIMTPEEKLEIVSNLDIFSEVL